MFPFSSIVPCPTLTIGYQANEMTSTNRFLTPYFVARSQPFQVTVNFDGSELIPTAANAGATGEFNIDEAEGIPGKLPVIYQ